ncbi:methyltransferase family protein [Herbidospora mongoliensis]|uniref:methyltransferase family protein n=1 Tax=Herbidospora mongoliensis TaxID=688067 RepID=UPI00082E4E5F|nr:methyltransferase [Herbidospora mongoliensis]
MPLPPHDPGPSTDLIGAMSFHGADAAVRLGVFDALPGSAAELAKATGADEEGLTLLLDLLTTTGYLVRHDDVFTASSLWTDSGYATPLRLWAAIIGEFWRDLFDGLATGRPRADFYRWLSGRPAELTVFHQLQSGLAGWLAEEVVDLIPMGPGRLADVGGGRGVFAQAFLDRTPGLSAVVVDLPGTPCSLPLVEADLAEPLVLTGYDHVLLFNVVHGFSRARARGLVHEAVASGADVHILETTTTPRGGVADQAFTEGFALNLWLTQGGRLYSADELSGWLREAGAADITRTDLTRSPTHTLITARSTP